MNRDKLMEQFAKPGDFCLNEVCPDYQKLQSQPGKPNIIKAGKTRKGVQRFQCQTCGKYFVETTGTIFYRKRTSEHEILETLALLAEGNRISSLTRVKGHKEDTILSWLREAAQQAEAVEEVLMKDYRIKRGQLDGLWAYVGNKGEKKLPGDC
jgi:transposase-like protein